MSPVQKNGRNVFNFVCLFVVDMCKVLSEKKNAK